MLLKNIIAEILIILVRYALEDFVAELDFAVRSVSFFGTVCFKEYSETAKYNVPHGCILPYSWY